MPSIRKSRDHEHLLVLPIVLPALTAAFLLLMGRQLTISRVISFVASALLLLIGIQLFQDANSGVIQTYVLGDWLRHLASY